MESIFTALQNHRLDWVGRNPRTCYDTPSVASWLEHLFTTDYLPLILLRFTWNLNHFEVKRVEALIFCCVMWGNRSSHCTHSRSFRGGIRCCALVLLSWTLFHFSVLCTSFLRIVWFMIMPVMLFLLLYSKWLELACSEVKQWCAQRCCSVLAAACRPVRKAWPRPCTTAAQSLCVCVALLLPLECYGFCALLYFSGLLESLLFSYTLLCMTLVHVFSLRPVTISSRKATHSSEHYQTRHVVTDIWTSHNQAQSYSCFP